MDGQKQCQPLVSLTRRSSRANAERDGQWACPKSGQSPARWLASLSLLLAAAQRMRGCRQDPSEAPTGAPLGFPSGRRPGDATRGAGQPTSNRLAGPTRRLRARNPLFSGNILDSGAQADSLFCRPAGRLIEWRAGATWSSARARLQIPPTGISLNRCLVHPGE